MTGHQSNNVLRLLDLRLKNIGIRGLSVTNYDLQSKVQIGFIYSSIVSNSLIEYRVSRL